MNTYQIHISGIVQGVGFRPFIYNLAKEQSLKGWVCNSSSGVYIRINSSETAVLKFINSIKKNAPEKSLILDLQFKMISFENFEAFSINKSFNGEEEVRSITPDYAICDNCLEELNNPNDRRYQYPFITCSHCGPRYSIIHKLPYDRELTSMHEFVMCEECQREYDDPSDRRFFSQSNSCKKCGVHLSLFDYKTQKTLKDPEVILKSICKEIEDGKIAAVKGIGGYMLMADATNLKTIELLRKRKNRPDKPFAVMVKDIEMLKSYAIPNTFEEKAFLSDSAPIVLLKQNKKASLPFEQIAPGLNEIGLLRPYSPLHFLIMDSLNKPLIATSANLSGSPLYFKDDEIIEGMKGIADLIVMHDREIISAQDDSVVRFSKKGDPIVIRRARGLAPNLLFEREKSKKSILALGAMLKSTSTLLFKGNTIVSQYIGNSNSYETQLSYSTTLDQLKNILEFESEIVLCDKHPGYFTSELAREYLLKYQIPIHKIQHHEAHFAAVLGENQLLNEEVLGFVWDGTGLGNDDAIWGGECFHYHDAKLTRIHHLPYQKHILGDKMVQEPRISALSYFNSIENSEALLKNKFTSIEWDLYQRQLTNSTLFTSSMGRLFDAVASLLNLKDKSTFHGQAAMLLEAKAAEYENGSDVKSYTFLNSSLEFDLQILLSEIIKEVNAKKQCAEIAFRFHYSLVEYIKWIAEKRNCKRLSFSGGVFQNKLLIDLITEKLSHYNLYFHQQLSPNDESVSFGQLMHYLHISSKSIV